MLVDKLEVYCEQRKKIIRNVQLAKKSGQEEMRAAPLVYSQWVRAVHSG